MIQFFKTKENSILAVECSQAFSAKDIEKLTWLFSGAQALEEKGSHRAEARHT